MPQPLATLLRKTLNLGLGLCLPLMAEAPTWHWVSPSSRTQAEAVFVAPDTPRVIWLSSPGTPTQRERLCTFERDAELLFSPDDALLALNDIVGSDRATLRLFRRVEGLRYRELDLDVDEACWTLLRQGSRAPYPGGLDHAYTLARQWSQDGSALLVSLSGHTDARHRVENWLCVYDLHTRRATLDLARLNRKAVVAGTRPSPQVPTP